jgi:hypothetical protein
VGYNRELLLKGKVLYSDFLARIACFVKRVKIHTKSSLSDNLPIILFRGLKPGTLIEGEGPVLLTFFIR